jgi:hypothetical protein
MVWSSIGRWAWAARRSSTVPLVGLSCLGDAGAVGAVEGKRVAPAGDVVAAVVDECVVVSADQDQVVQVGGAVVAPPANVVGLEVVCGRAAGEAAAAAVADPEGE